MNGVSTRLKWAALACTLATIAIGVIWNKMYMDARIEQVAQRLVLLSNLRRDALEEFFITAEAELRFWSINEGILEQQASLVQDWVSYSRLEGNPETTLQDLYVYGNPYPWGELHKLNNAYDGSRYSEIHAQLHPMARLFVTERGYYDFFLIAPEGDVLYSVAKEKDFATNLITGEWHDTGLARVFHRALETAREDKVVISDMSLYGPSDDEPAIFMAKAMLGVKGEVLGVLALQLPTGKVTDIMNFRAGMGKSGETYAVGEDLLMRSNSRFSETSTVLQTRVDTPTVRQALDGNEGVAFTPDYRGIEVLSAYTQSRTDGFSWAVMAEIDRDEILEMAADERPAIGSIMLFLYGLSLWSLWFGSRNSDDEVLSVLADLDFEGGDPGDGGAGAS